MAEPTIPVYVEVANFIVKDTFDPKYKSSLPKLMIEAANKTIDAKYKRRATIKKPSDKTSPAIFLTGSLSLKTSAKGLTADISIPFGTLDLAKNQRSIKGSWSESADAQGVAVEDVVKGLVSGAVEDNLEEALELV